MKSQIGYNKMTATVPRKATNEATDHDEGPLMVKVALLEPFDVVDGEAEELDMEDMLVGVVGVDMVCDTEDNEDAEVGVLIVADGVADGMELDGVVLLFGVPIIWPLPIK
jgi:hypothetical protein